ncbi:hypothetical protein J7M00_03830, partial [bacterium]|nr:hypothetical protein [bacterium]
MEWERIKVDGFRIVTPEVKYVADVIVYRTGPYAVAKNKHGERIAASEDHAEVWQKAVNKAPDNGVVRGLGEFKITKPIYAKSNITVIGGKFIQKMDNEAIFKSPASSWADAIKNIKFIRCVFRRDDSVTTPDAGISLR